MARRRRLYLLAMQIEPTGQHLSLPLRKKDLSCCLQSFLRRGIYLLQSLPHLDSTPGPSEKVHMIHPRLPRSRRTLPNGSRSF